MPSTYAHKKFGALVYKKLPEEIREIVADNREFFLAGLHGPDVLFFHKAGYHSEVTEIGRRIHKESFEKFYIHGAAQLYLNDSEERLSYFIGCMCHYMLDSACHPIINKAMDELGMTHGKVEQEFDRYLLEKDEKTPLKYPSWAHIPVSFDVAKEASDFYEGVSPEEFFLALTTMKAVLMACGSNSNTIRHTLCTVMEKTGNEGKIASLIMSRQKSDMIRKNVKELYSVLISEIDETADYIEKFVGYYEDGFATFETPKRLKMDFNGKRKQTAE